VLVGRDLCGMRGHAPIMREIASARAATARASPRYPAGLVTWT
jgi:hypothetical protein